MTVEWNPPGDKYRATLVVGRHRLEAFRRLEWTMIPATIFGGSALEAEQWQIAENVCRRELTVLERAEQIARWVKLQGEKRAQPAQVSGGRGHKGGLSAAADTLDVDRRTVRRGLQVAGLADEAKTVAVRLGLDDNQSALIKAAGAGGATEQIKSLQASARKPVPRSPEQIAAQKAATNAAWRSQTDWVVCAAESLFEWLGTEHSQDFLTMIDKTAMPEVAPIQIVDRLR